MAEVFVGRQPIFTAALDVYGYELLFRSPGGGPIEDPEHATAQVLVNTFMEFGLASLVGQAVPFVNVTRPFLSGEIPLPFVPGSAVLEILETVEVDDETVADVERLVDAGHRFALDDYIDTPQARRLLDLAEIMKIDVLATPPDAVSTLVDMARRSGLKVLAEKVETEEQLAAGRDLNFDYYQGYLLSRPTVLQQESIEPGRLGLIQLVTMLGDPRSSFEQIEAVVRLDPALSYRLLRLVNSAGIGLRRQLSSIREAVIMLGRSSLRRWLLVMLLAEGSPASNELLIQALVRARMSELLGPEAGCSPDVAFTTGLLSSLDRLLAAPLATILASLPLDLVVTAALLEGAGPLGRLMQTITAYESGSPAAERPLAISSDVLRRAWADATAWAVAATELVATDDEQVGSGTGPFLGGPLRDGSRSPASEPGAPGRQ